MAPARTSAALRPASGTPARGRDNKGVGKSEDSGPGADLRCAPAPRPREGARATAGVGNKGVGYFEDSACDGDVNKPTALYHPAEDCN